MIQKIKILVAGMLAMLGLIGMVPAIASAASPSIQNSLCSGANNLQVNNTPTTSCTDITTNEGNFNTLLEKIINIMSIIVGVVAVIMIIIGGFRYITSGGDSTKVAGAKNTILYGLIGLVIVALAQVVVKFVLHSVTV